MIGGKRKDGTALHRENCGAAHETKGASQLLQPAEAARRFGEIIEVLLQGRQNRALRTFDLR
jgi:hypothetical protein